MNSPSLFMSDVWERFENEVQRLKTERLLGDGYSTKVTASKSQIPFVKKYWLGGYWSVGTGIGFYCDSPEVARLLFDKTMRWKSGMYQGFSNVPIPGISKPFISRIIDISLPDKKLMASFSKKRRNSIRRGIKKGVTVKIVWDLKPILRIISDIKSEYPYWKRDLKKLEKELFFCMRNRLVRFFVAFVDGCPVAISLFLTWNKRMTYSINGFKREYSDYCPMDVLMFEAMKWGRQNEFTELDMMGGATKSCGIGKFKNSFGGVLETRHFFSGVKIGGWINATN